MIHYLNKRNFQIVIVSIFAIIFFAVSFMVAKRESLTYDEIVYLQEGIVTLKTHKFANFDTNNPPLIRDIAIIPYIFENKDDVFNDISLNRMMPARLVVILLSVALLILVYKSTKKFFGQKAAIFSLFLFIFEPNILANNHYFTLDIGLTLFFFLSYVFFLKLFKKTSLNNFLLFGASLGLAVSSKITAIFYFLFIIPCVLLLEYKKKCFSWFINNKKYLSLSLLLAFFVIWGTYFFTTDVLVAKRNDLNRVSSRLLKSAKDNNNKALESLIYFTENQKMPLGSYLAAVKNAVIRSGQENNTFFMGNFYSKNSWYFMPFNFFLKTPLPLWIFLIISLYLFFKKKTERKKYLYFLFPFILILFFSSFSHMSPWIRYILPLYPFLIILASVSVKFFNTFYLKLIFILLCLWYSYGTLSYSPHFISFANELSGERSKRYEKFIDSNIDWGQSLFDFKKYIEAKRPDIVNFSYFGRDNADNYGLKSDKAYGSHRSNDVCVFHKIKLSDKSEKVITAISVSNWYYCGYYKNIKYSNEKIIDVAGDSILIFK